MGDAEFISNLIRYLKATHAVSEASVFETHISWVILVADFAYKIKKPVNFGFVDFSTLDKREYFCRQELSLNRRLAPELYLEVLPICGSPQAPQLNGGGDIIDWTLKLKRFDPQLQLDKLADTNSLTPAMIDDIIQQISAFHQSADIIGDSRRQGNAQQVHQSVMENVAQIRTTLDNSFRSQEQAGIDQQLNKVTNWLHQQYSENKPLMQQRKDRGCIRDCHGDLHLANMAWHGDRALIFDCIEFNDSFRYIDVFSDLAFLLMDLMHRRYSGLACLGLNRYLQRGGDYQGLPLLRYYMVYRALVRAKVSLLSCTDGLIPKAFQQYLSLALAICTSPTPALFITHGVSGSGKSHGVRSLYKGAFFIHLASDIVRKRSADYSKAPHAPNEGPYSAQSRQSVYYQLQQLAASTLKSGLPCVVDATFLSQENRKAMARIAASHNAEFHILHFEANTDTLRQRIQQRQKRKQSESDADVAVLELQLDNYTPLSKHELTFCLDLEQAQHKLQNFLNNFP